MQDFHSIDECRFLFGNPTIRRLRKISQAPSFTARMDEKPQGNTPSTPASSDVSPWALAGLGLQFCLAMLVFAYAGLWIDRRYGTMPIFLLLGVFLGGGGTFALSIRRLTASSTRKSAPGPTEPSPPR
jgi:F0F1-type ATP synthase assembly protein I